MQYAQGQRHPMVALYLNGPCQSAEPLARSATLGKDPVAGVAVADLAVAAEERVLHFLARRSGLAGA